MYAPINAYNYSFGLTLKPTNFYNIKNYVNKVCINLKVNYMCYAHITDFRLITYKRIQALLYTK